MDWLDTPLAPALAGLLGGVLLGLAARRGRFCTLGAIEDALYGQDWNRLRMWALALSLAIGATFLLDFIGLIDREASLYSRLEWNPVSAILGGLTFGYGMAIAGNCGYGALARLGGGDLRSLVIVVVMGIAAYAVISGPLAGLRLSVFPVTPGDTGVATGYADLIASGVSVAPLAPALALSAGLAALAFWERDFRRSPGLILWSGVAAIAIVSGWLATTLISRESFDVVGVESHSFTAPVGETMLYAMTSSAGGLSFGVGSVLGVILGAFIGSISLGQFRWEACDDAGELGRQILGGALMGIGGILALGCSVGQGLTAFSTLAYSAPVVLASIAVGAVLGLRQLVRGFAPG